MFLETMMYKLCLSGDRMLHVKCYSVIIALRYDATILLSPYM